MRTRLGPRPRPMGAERRADERPGKHPPHFTQNPRGSRRPSDCVPVGWGVCACTFGPVALPGTHEAVAGAHGHPPRADDPDRVRGGPRLQSLARPRENQRGPDKTRVLNRLWDDRPIRRRGRRRGAVCRCIRTRRDLHKDRGRHARDHLDRPLQRDHPARLRHHPTRLLPHRRQDLRGHRASPWLPGRGRRHDAGRTGSGSAQQCHRRGDHPADNHRRPLPQRRRGGPRLRRHRGAPRHLHVGVPRRPRDDSAQLPQYDVQSRRLDDRGLLSGCLLRGLDGPAHARDLRGRRLSVRL